MTLMSALASHFKVLFQSFFTGTVRQAILYGDRSCFLLLLKSIVGTILIQSILFRVGFGSLSLAKEPMLRVTSL